MAKSTSPGLFATLRLRGRPGRDGCQRALWDCFGGRIYNMAANLSPKTVPQCNHPDHAVSGETSKWRIGQSTFLARCSKVKTYHSQKCFLKNFSVIQEENAQKIKIY